MTLFDPAVINRELGEADYAARTGSAHLMVWGRAHEQPQIEALAALWNVKLFVLGHQHVETGADFNGPLLLVLNSDHERAAALPIDLSQPPPTALDAMLDVVPLAGVPEPAV
jgi:hypothetical protein